MAKALVAARTGELSYHYEVIDWWGPLVIKDENDTHIGTKIG